MIMESINENVCHSLLVELVFSLLGHQAFLICTSKALASIIAADIFFIKAQVHGEKNRC